MTYNLLDQNIGEKVVFNHSLKLVDDSLIEDISQYESDTQYYEVIRCINYTPLFLEDHIDRLKASANDIAINEDNLIEDISLIIEQENIENANIKIVYTKNISLVFASKYYYPGADVYEKGVNLGLLKWERINPNQKVVRADYKKSVAKKLSDIGPFGKYFETLLISKNNTVSEGSRSNVFFIKENLVYTAPDEDILKGITRKYVLEAIKESGCKLITQAIEVNDIYNKVDGAFITGTSIFVLPVYSIEDKILNSGDNRYIKEITNNFRKIVNFYIQNHNKK